MSRKIVQATTSFSMNIGNVPVMVAPRDMYFDDDEVVRRNPAAFSDIEVKSTVTGKRTREAVSSTTSVEETASAEPGIRRRLGRPPKATTAEVTVEPVPVTSEV